MVFEQIKMACQVCQEKREEQFLSVNSRQVDNRPAGGNTVTYTARYCNDKDACVSGAVQLLKDWMENDTRA